MSQRYLVMAHALESNESEIDECLEDEYSGDEPRRATGKEPEEESPPINLFLSLSVLTSGIVAGLSLPREAIQLGIHLHFWPVLGLTLIVYVLDELRFCLFRNLMILFLLSVAGFLFSVRINSYVPLPDPNSFNARGSVAIGFFCLCIAWQARSCLVAKPIQQ